VISTFHGLELLKRALFANETLMNTTGHNISNANTPGYSRQRVDLTEMNPLYYPGMTMAGNPGALGTGVTMEDITRIRDTFLDQRYRDENSSLGQWTQIQTTVNQITAVFNEPSDTGLSTVMSKFFNSWAQLVGRAESSDDPSARAVVLSQAQELTDMFNSTAAKLNAIKQNLQTNIQADVQQANTYLQQISDLTKQINDIEANSGDRANDLRDQRDQLLDELSQLADVSVTDSNGSFQVKIGGQVVVDNGNPPTLLQVDDTGALSVQVSSGKLKGYVDSLNSVSNYQSMLDTMVNTFVQGKATLTLSNVFIFAPNGGIGSNANPYSSAATTMPFDAVLPDGTQLKKGDPIPTKYTMQMPDGTVVNTLPKGTQITVDGFNGLHQLGYTMQDPSGQAPPFFQTSDQSSTFTAANIRVSDAVLKDLRNIASSLQVTQAKDSNGNNVLKVVHGNGDLAMMAAAFQNAELDFSNSPANGMIFSKGTVGEFYTAIIDQMGIQGQQANMNVKNQQALVNQVDNQRQSISGVSIDEEMANMIKFQQSYNAAARMVTVMDQMYDKLINGMGIGGR
jgi:flagellar hook-associated protein 1 FlgK